MITKQEVEHIAKLARLGLTETETEKLGKELSKILDYFNLLKEVNVSKVKPTSHSVLVENIMREDELREKNLADVNKLVEAVPERKGRYIKVKAIF